MVPGETYDIPTTEGYDEYEPFEPAVEGNTTFSLFHLITTSYMIHSIHYMFDIMRKTCFRRV